MISAIDRAYCAGLFEGEGSIFSSYRASTNGTSTQRSIVLTISMSDRFPLDLFGDAIGAGSLRGPYSTKGGTKPMYEYRVGRFEIVQFAICNMWQWLSPRRKEQCIKAIKNYTEFGLTNKPKKLRRNNRGDYR